MLLTPVLIVQLVAGRGIARRACLLGFAAAKAGAFAYVARGWPAAMAILPEGHKYEQLLAICLAVPSAGFAGVLAGARKG